MLLPQFSSSKTILEYKSRQEFNIPVAKPEDYLLHSIILVELTYQNHDDLRAHTFLKILLPNLPSIEIVCRLLLKPLNLINAGFVVKNITIH